MDKVQIRIGRITYQLLKRLDEPQRFQVLRDAIIPGKATALIVDGVTTLGQQHGKYSNDRPDPENERIVNEQHLKELENLALGKIRQSAKDGTLLQAPQLVHLLHRWRDWGGDKEVMDWVRNLGASDEGLILLLIKFYQKSISQSAGDVVAKFYHRLDPKWLEPFIDPATIFGRVKKIADDITVDESIRAITNQFVKEYEMRQNGQDPSHPSSWVE